MDSSLTAHIAVDPLGFIDEVGRCSIAAKAHPLMRWWLLKAVADRLNLIDLPMRPLKRSWKIDVTNMNQMQAAKAVAVRVRLASWHGVDAHDYFQIDEKEIHELSLHLADTLHLHRLRQPLIQTIPGYEDVVRFTGLPDLDVTLVGRWFRRQLTRSARRLADYFGFLMFDIGRYANPIVSRETLESRERQLLRQKEYAANHRLVTTCQNGEKIAINFTDPARSAWQRSSKIYAHLKGLDEFCVKQKLDGFFVTLTVPPAFHPNPANGNISWDGSTPKEAHDWLQKLWRYFQKRFGEAGGKVFGVRVEEPHEDGCPHWHLLIYINPKRENEFRERISKTFGSDAASDVRRIDRTKGNGASYLMKYVSPRFAPKVLSDRAEVTSKQDDGSTHGKEAKASLYDAFRATWGGRSIQFFDIPGCSTVWDEIRRIKKDSADFDRLSTGGKRLHLHATNTPPEFGKFMRTLRVLSRVSKNYVRVLYGSRKSGTGYVRGLLIDGEIYETHMKSWKVERITNGK